MALQFLIYLYLFDYLKAIQLQGFEADRHLLRCLFSHIDLNESKGSRNVSNQNYFQAKLLAEQCKTLLKNPSLTSILCFALDNPFNIKKVGIYLYFILVNNITFNIF